MNVKVVAGAGGAGFVLSFLFGLFSGNPFGVILLRVLLSAIGAAGLGAAFSLLADRFLPELSAGGATQSAPGHVDIVIPGENPHGDGREPTDSDAGTELPEVGEEADLDIGDAEEVLEAGEPLPHEAGGGETERGETEGDESDGAPDSSDAVGVAEEVGEEAQEPVAPVGRRVDMLGGHAGMVSVGGEQQEPEIVARALRTMMKRDEEG